MKIMEKAKGRLNKWLAFLNARVQLVEMLQEILTKSHSGIKITDNFIGNIDIETNENNVSYLVIDCVIDKNGKNEKNPDVLVIPIDYFSYTDEEFEQLDICDIKTLSTEKADKSFLLN